MRGLGKSFREIAELVDCSKSTVYFTLRHPSLRGENQHLPWYELGKVVQEAVKAARSYKRERGWQLKNQRIRSYVTEQLKNKLSPENISREISRELVGESISAEAIYQYAYKTDRSLLKYLVRSGRTKRTNRGSLYRSRQREAEMARRSLETRFQAATDREELGHKESDFVVSSRGGKSCLLVVVDRMSRKISLRLTPNREAETTRKALFQILNQEQAKSLTVDNDSAHNRLPMLEPVLDMKVYFCKPHSPWQRGSVEAIIGILRRWFPRGTNFDDVTEDYVVYVEAWFNKRTMKVLGGVSPLEFEEQLQLAA